MRVKILSFFVSVLALSALLAPPILAAGEVTKSQSVDFFSLPVPDFSMVTYYDDHTLNVPFRYRGVIEQNNNGSINFPSSPQYTHAARCWDFAGTENQITLGTYTEVFETYTLPSWDFVFSGVSVSITYVQRFRGNEGTSAAKVVELSINGGGLFTPTISNVGTLGNIYQWTLNLDDLSSSDFHTLTFKTTYDYPMTKYNGVLWLSGVFPMTVTTSYDYATAYSQATFDLIQNGITPTVDHISEQMDNTAAEMSRIAEQQAAIHSEILVQPSKNQAAMSQALEDHDQHQYEWGIQQGDNAVDSAVDKIPFEKITLGQNCFARLITAVTSDHRTSVWDFPQLKLPAINGVMPEIELTPGVRSISFDYWFNKLPVVTQTLIRAFCTAALAYYIILELIRLIENTPKGVKS